MFEVTPISVLLGQNPDESLSGVLPTQQELFEMFGY
jgi:hypothetical protein